MANLKLQIEGKEVSYQKHGDGSKPLLVCFHGLAGNGFYSFGKLIPLLADRYQLLVLDSPGHGESAPFDREEEYSFANLAARFKQVVDQLSAKPFFVMGHSWGADLALHFARHYPDRVLGIVLLDGGFTFPQNQPEMTIDYALSGWTDYMDNCASFQNWQAVIEEYRQYTKEWDSGIESGIKTIFRQNEKGEFELLVSKFTVLSIIQAFFREPFTDVYPFIHVPLLLVYPDSPSQLDGARALGIMQLQEAIEDAAIRKIEHAGHMLQWDKPVETADAVSSWLDEKCHSATKA
ncbi:alpha/beta hydrolase [Planococcus liqunii]|uniref:alpha/beta fold hydrolase n=1 Tax=Planococcus liqunii TaxID=3058394 RepID=UPI00260EC67E|nr:alpha/beta hydrolase [Planococcus sp. N056]WKA50889.1 alpha/beta hydrolase [Planococcus sp. N056]